MADFEVAPSFEGDSPAASDPETLPDRRELALVAVERTRMPMVVTDPRKPDNPIVLANDAFLELTGYTADEVVGRNCRFLQGPGTAPSDIDRMRRELADGKHNVAVELLNYRKDGSSFWNQLAISPVHSENGELLYHFASQKDVSARRRAQELEATEHLLLKEVDHRAMNALALVQSIVRLSRSDDVATYTNAVLRRVDALARAHRLLAAAGWSGADLSDVIAIETPQHVMQRVTAAGPPALLSAKLVQPITLVLHELMTNAGQHGALAGPDGKVAVDWTSEPAGLTVSWREAGGAMATRNPACGFGLAMVKGVLERQLGGSFTPRLREHGLEASLAIPYG